MLSPIVFQYVAHQQDNLRFLSFLQRSDYSRGFVQIQTILLIANIMKAILALVALCLLGLYVQPATSITVTSSSSTCKKVFYDFYVLALTWPNEFCLQNTCARDWKQKWNGRSLSIHGFWPSSTDLSYLNCFREKSYDPYCYRGYDFNLSQFSSDEQKQLNTYWPILTTKQNFWEYEWDKHGTCYLYIIKDEEKSNLTASQIFKKYFMETIAKVKLMNPRLTPGKIDTKADLGKQLGLKASEFYAICGNDNELDELRICYDIYPEPGKEYLMECPKSNDRSQCKFPIVIN